MDGYSFVKRVKGKTLGLTGFQFYFSLLKGQSQNGLKRELNAGD